jgi:superfamily II DNA/RNA helicase
VDAVSIHGGKDQVDRNKAILQFKNMEKDVLIATDIAAKVIAAALRKQTDNLMAKITKGSYVI